MRTFNISDPAKYYRQNNNEIRPLIRCKPTATVEALDLAGWPLPAGAFRQPEDNLTAYCEAKWGQDAPEDWDCIVKAVNGAFSTASVKPIIGPRYDWDVREALFGITRGLPFVASTWLTTGGHVVNIVGFTTREDVMPAYWLDLKFDAVETIIIDDPYGSKVSGAYDTKASGFNNVYSKSDFLKFWRGTGIQVRRN